MTQTARTPATGGEGPAVELRFHNPYRGWLTGLLTEVAVFLAFILAVAALVLLAAQVA